MVELPAGTVAESVPKVAGVAASCAESVGEVRTAAARNNAGRICNEPARIELLLRRYVSVTAP
jgi:hypothetical protein